MKKNLFTTLLALCLPLALVAQSVNDDLYFTPSKKKEKKQEQSTIIVESEAPTTVVESSRPATVIVERSKKKKRTGRDVDEYNRRYDSKDYSFSQSDDTLYVTEREDARRSVYDDDLEGEWVGGEFEGSDDDYEYATRIIRFRNPRFAISVSSPLYWDVVYGLNSWDWNIYTDGLYAYAFPTFSNRLWWDWRYNSSFAFGWGWGWNYPYYHFGWDPWYGSSWGWGHHYHHHHHYYPHYGWGSGGGHWGHGSHHWGNAYTNRRAISMGRYNGAYRNNPLAGNNRRPGVQSGQQNRRTAVRREAQPTRRSTTTQVRRTDAGSNRRVVGTRNTNVRRSERGSAVRQAEGGAVRRSTYTRPSSTRSNAAGARQQVEGVRRNGYNRGSSATSRRSYNNINNGSRSNNSYTSPSRSSSNRSSFGSSSSGSSRSSGSSYSGGGSSRSSGGGGSRRR